MNTPSRFLLLARTALFVVVASIVAGCASSVPDARFTRPMAAADRVVANDSVRAKVAGASGVTVAEDERQRMVRQIEAEVRAAAASSGGRSARNYEIDVILTRYEKGNAFARMMMAGLGQIHIDGNVTVYQLPSRTKVAEFTASKTFAWGGMYGGATSIEGIEKTFAQIIAKAVCGK